MVERAVREDVVLADVQSATPPPGRLTRFVVGKAIFLATAGSFCASLGPASAPAPAPATVAPNPPIGVLDAPTDQTFKASYDGSVQQYMLALPQGYDASAPHDLLIAFHGHGADRHQYMTDPRGSLQAVRDVAGKYSMIVATPDYRAPTSWMGPAAEADTIQLIGELKKLYKVRKVILVGGSMGGSSVLTFTALHPELVDGVSSQNGTANLLEYEVNFVNIQYAIKDSFGGGKDETPEQYKERNPDEYTKRSAEFHAEKFTMPTAITVGAKDTIVPSQSAVRLAEAIKKHNPNVLLMVDPNGEHETTYETAFKALEFVILAATRGKS